ncbi:rubredoxin [Brachymonas denitrificans]|uniref:Rubredoxin n=3 Tax=Brachymonas denitrificans TaxID=28220 RepID=A0A1H8ERT7_9BURK|nr:rubredoxin [Brachymonas denitrificans]SEN22229.1 Rubredoxin [Brachymonas denitrificans DSM 15123]
MSQWMCIPCGMIYDEAAGMPEHGIAPGTRFADIPHDWTCPDCGVGKDDFVEIPD